MRILGRIWKILLSLLLLAGAAFVFFKIYLPNQASYEVQRASLMAQNQVLQQQANDNARYSSVDIDQLEKENGKMENSRLELYRKLPQEFRPEDQIIYVTWMEESFGTEIYFQFGDYEPILALSDGSMLCGVPITVNFESTYDGYKHMIDTLATNERVASVRASVISNEDPTSGRISGYVTVVHYVLLNSPIPYQSPVLVAPPTGKSDIFDP